MITVVTPALDAARFVEACVRSVAAEAEEVELEHVVVDGASTDETSAILRRLSGSMPHLRWISEPDRGQSDALNKGIAMARGEILGILNVDDFYEPGALARALTFLAAETSPALVLGNCKMWDEHSRLLGVNRPNKLRLVELLQPENESFLPLNPSQYIYHRALHELIGPYPVEEHFTLDIDFFLRAAAVANLKYVDEDWGNFRLLPGSKTHGDIQSGRASTRLSHLLSEHRQRLPLRHKLELGARRWLARLKLPAL